MTSYQAHNALLNGVKRRSGGAFAVVNLRAPHDQTLPATAVQLRFTFLHADGSPARVTTRVTFFDFDNGWASSMRECMQVHTTPLLAGTRGSTLDLSDNTELRTFTDAQSISAHVDTVLQGDGFDLWNDRFVCSTTPGRGVDKCAIAMSHCSRFEAAHVMMDSDAAS
jgi:hypothetical protein